MSTAANKAPTLYTIPAGVSFVDTLAKGLLEEVGDNREKLASTLILLPTRRACRTLQEAFLRQTGGAPLLLPRMQPFGDIDAEELFITGQGDKDIEIPPAISALKRQILLAQTISKLPDFTKGAEQDIALAKALGQLMDQIHTEGLNLNDLPNIVDRDAFAAHWQITVDFLSILSEHWPKILQEHGLIDSADRRNRLINALNTHWQNNPPTHPIIAAGSTGSIPATAALLKTISCLPQGSLILPALDQEMSMESWNAVNEGHPQATLKQLIEYLEGTRQDVKNWPHTPQPSETMQARETLISNVMVPPEKTDTWKSVGQDFHTNLEKKEALQNTLKNIKQYDCATPQEEAQLISLLLRETLEDKTKTAALITPDRNLARRVAMACRRWQIEIDDSAGQSLSESNMGSYLRLCAQASIENVQPLSLLSLLKHDYCQGAGFKNFRSTIRSLDRDLLRGTKPAAGFSGLHKQYEQKINDPKNKRPPSPDVLKLLNHLEPIMAPLIEKLSEGFHDFSEILEEHIRLAELLAKNLSADESTLWQGEEGEATANFLSELREHAAALPRVNGHNYLAILNQFMKGVTIRPRFGTHPRLMILGQLEARLVQADRVILAGLNEGTWPPDPGHDPWMSRPMRKSFGLPAPERAITLAAHDFVQGFCSNEVFITRSTRVDGTPTVPARWLQRLETFLQAIEIDPATLHEGPHKNYLEYLDKNDGTQPVKRPAPCPPISARPQKLSVTKIETWIKDPYAIYAKEILKLNKLDPIEKSPDAAERGTILHKIMENFTDEYPKNIPDNASDNFITITRAVLEEKTNDSAEWNFWIPRMMKLADWLIPHEQQWRQNATFGKAEIDGALTLTEGLNRPFTLTARADRIDILSDSSAAIIDYKSGGTFAKSKMESGDLPQLPLEALMLNKGGFSKSGIQKKSVSAISYWKLTGGTTAGEITTLDDPKKLQQSIENAEEGLINLINIFENNDTPYYAIPKLDNAPRFNDYEYLERVKEWTALGETNEEAA